MKQVYNDILLKPGITNAGISKIQIVPKQFVTSDINVDFATGKVTEAVTLLGDASFTELQFAPLSYDYEEKTKITKSGQAVSVTILGLMNDLDDAQLQTIESFRMSELVVIATDRKKRKRIIGNKEYGMIFSFDNKNANNPNGNQKAQITLIFDSEYYPPFYQV
jgi:hypothetical protein